MGTWGVGAFDNDSAADMVIKLMKPIRIVATRKSSRSASYHYNEARAAAQVVLLAHGSDILGGPDLDLVLRALVRISKDEEWIDNWRDPREIIARLGVEIRATRRAMKNVGVHPLLVKVKKAKRARR